MYVFLSPNEFVTYLLNGISQGMIIFLVASGLTLIFGLIGLINFAHGALVALGGYTTFVVASATGSFWGGILLGVGLVALLGLLIERSVLHRVYEKPLLGFLGTFGMYIVIEELISYQFGDQSRQVVSPVPGAINFRGISYPRHRLLVIGIGVIVAVAIGALLTRTRLGMEIHAASTQPETAEILGVNSQRVYTVTFVIGAALAALAGGLIAPITAVSPGMGMDYLILAFLVIIVGGMGSFKGSLVSSLIVGQIIAFGWLFTQPTYVRLSIFIAAMIFILFKPRGFFGKPEVFE